MTPNYLSNSSKEVALWCTCEGSGNHWSDCQRVLNMFTSNTCLKNAINSLGNVPAPTPETTPAPTFHPSPRMQQDHGNSVTTSNGLTNVKVIANGNSHLNHSANSLPGLRRDEEAEEEDEDEEEDSREFNVIPPYTKKESSTGAEAWGVHRGGAPPSSLPQPTALLLLLVSTALGLGYLG